MDTRPAAAAFHDLQMVELYRSWLGKSVLPNRDRQGVPVGLRPTKGDEDALWQIQLAGGSACPTLTPVGQALPPAEPASSTEPVL